MHLFAFFIVLPLGFVATHARPSTTTTLPVQWQKRQSNSYPTINQTPPISSLPKPWLDALNALVQQGKVPNIPASTVDASGVNTYPGSLGSSHDVCSWTTLKCFGTNDISRVPDGLWGLSFDDGPTQASPALYQFLAANNQSATHFMIGSQIAGLPTIFQQAVSTPKQEFAVHTWSHSLMTTKSNEEIVGELGWNMQVIYDMSGRVPTLWRPPQGDIDNRVRAIAEGVFGLRAVMWNAESNDWCLQQDGSSACSGRKPGDTMQSVLDAIRQTMDKPKSPGILLLQHELSTPGVSTFTQTYPSLRPKGWTPTSVSDALNFDWYQNAKNDQDTPTKVSDMASAHNNKLVQASSSTTNNSAATNVNNQTVPSTSTNDNPKATTAQPSAEKKKNGASTSIFTPTLSSLFVGTIVAAVANFVM